MFRQVRELCMAITSPAVSRANETTLANVVNSFHVQYILQAMGVVIELQEISVITE